MKKTINYAYTNTTKKEIKNALTKKSVNKITMQKIVNFQIKVN